MVTCSSTFLENRTSAYNVLEVVFGTDFRFQIYSLVFQMISRCAQPPVGQCIVYSKRYLTANLREQIQICLGEAVFFRLPSTIAPIGPLAPTSGSAVTEAMDSARSICVITCGILSEGFSTLGWRARNRSRSSCATEHRHIAHESAAGRKIQNYSVQTISTAVE